MIKTDNQKQTIAYENLLASGLDLRRTKLGQSVFIPKDTEGRFADKMLFPDSWSSAELRAIADYMDAFPDCTLFSDGSGVKLTETPPAQSEQAKTGKETI